MSSAIARAMRRARIFRDERRPRPIRDLERGERGRGGGRVARREHRRVVDLGAYEVGREARDAREHGFPQRPVLEYLRGQHLLERGERAQVQEQHIRRPISREQLGPRYRRIQPNVVEPHDRRLERRAAPAVADHDELGAVAQRARERGHDAMKRLPFADVARIQHHGSHAAPPRRGPRPRGELDELVVDAVREPREATVRITRAKVLREPP